MASTSRKSSLSVVTVRVVQVAPPSVVRKTVEPDPLAHATRSLTALTPRSRAVTPLVCSVQIGRSKIRDRRSMFVIRFWGLWTWGQDRTPTFRSQMSDLKGTKYKAQSTKHNPQRSAERRVG